jgi:hypothetical protein
MLSPEVSLEGAETFTVTEPAVQSKSKLEYLPE